MHSHTAPQAIPSTMSAEPETPNAEPEGSEPATAAAGSERTCPSCAAPVAEEQLWCLRCGSEVAGGRTRYSARRPLSAGVMAAILALGAAGTAFAYDTISTEAPPTLAQQPPAVAPPATPPGAVPATPAQPKAPKADTVTPLSDDFATAPSDSLPPLSDATASSADSGSFAPDLSGGDFGATGGIGGSTGSSGTSGSSGAGTDTEPAPPEPERVKVKPSSGSAYDPYGRAAAAAAQTPTTPGPGTTTTPPSSTTTTPGTTTPEPESSPSLALDRRDDTFWTSPRVPAGQPVNAGILIDLGEARKLTRVELDTSTPGFDVEVFGVKGKVPDTITGGWKGLSSRSGVASEELLDVRSSKPEVRFVLVWVTKLPPGTEQVEIGELRVRAEPKSGA